MALQVLVKMLAAHRNKALKTLRISTSKKEVSTLVKMYCLINLKNALRKSLHFLIGCLLAVRKSVLLEVRCVIRADMESTYSKLLD
jgi:hypothetical protein